MIYTEKDLIPVHMSRKLILAIIVIGALVGAMAYFASMDLEQPLTPVEKPVIGGDFE